MADEGEVEMGAPGIDGAFACETLAAAGPPAEEETGYVTYARVGGRCAVAGACAEPVAGRGVDSTVAA